jgi:hypothetical protein
VKECKGDTQTVTIFNEKGNLLEKINKWSYSTTGDLINFYDYNNQGLLSSKTKQVGDSLLQRDKFIYNSDGTLLDWKIDQGNHSYSQHYTYNTEGYPQVISVKKEEETIRRDSIFYEFDEQNRPKREWSRNLSGEIADSLLYSYGKDTLSRKALIIGDRLSFIYYKIKFGKYDFVRVEEYTDGHFMGVYSRMYDNQGNLLKERNIHHYTSLNYTKNYIYDNKGLLKEKQVFKDTYEPSHVVLYNYEHY